MNQTIDWAAFKQAIAGIAHTDDARTLQTKSRDYYWYSPILAEQLDDKRGELIVSASSEAEVIRVAAACAKFRVPVTVRGGGTGNYGQCVPLEGGVILDVTGLDKVIACQPGMATVQAGCLIEALEIAARKTGQEILMFPSTLKIATIGGFIAGGYAGVGSIYHGILKDTGNVTRLRVVTLEEAPRVIELRDADIQKVHHAFGTNGIITELDVALAPAQEWWHVIVLFDDYIDTLRCGKALSRPDVITRLVTAVDRRFHPYYREFGDAFPAGKDALFAMVARQSLGAFATIAAQFGGIISLNKTEPQLAAEHLPPAYECAYNHTTLMALKHDRSWTYLQIAYPQPFDPESTRVLMDEFGDEVLMHHEFGKQFGDYVTFALPLIAYIDKERVYEIARRFEAAGCTVFDPHVYTIEDGGMKTIDHAQIDFKRVADPHGLMNPGKTRGWTKAMAVP
jgi:FAD/FMN-containing dehydrogenase